MVAADDPLPSKYLIQTGSCCRAVLVQPVLPGDGGGGGGPDPGPGPTSSARS